MEELILIKPIIEHETKAKEFIEELKKHIIKLENYEISFKLCVSYF